MSLLRLDWCSHKAAKYAVEHWHYSKCLAVSKSNYIGVWEDGKYIGVVIFSLGASQHLGNIIGLKQFEFVELTRVALSKHKTPVTRIIKIAIKLLRERNPGIQAIISFADTEQGHNGCIYQGGGWVYTGTSAEETLYKYKGKFVHARTLGTHFNNLTPTCTDRSQIERKKTMGKHRYIYPLTEVTKIKAEQLK